MLTFEEQVIQFFEDQAEKNEEFMSRLDDLETRLKNLTTQSIIVAENCQKLAESLLK
jgi:tetrahydromethanopterin S-methyltransferase subunit G